MLKTLKEYLSEAKEKRVAIGHFNISDIAALHAIFDSARELDLPVIIGVSEGEREFIGVKEVAALVRSLREQFEYPIFLNADHTYNISGIEEAAKAGFDMVIFDGAKLSFEDNVRETKNAVDVAKSINPNILVEGEIGYIGTSSKLLDEIPAGALVDEKSFPTAEVAKEFVSQTGIDLLAPAVGNIHGMLKNAKEPALHIKRIEEISLATGIPLVLHGGSGTSNEDFVASVDAGMRVIHINTEIRVAWRRGVELALGSDANEVSPYKILALAKAEIEKVVKMRLKLFNKI